MKIDKILENLNEKFYKGFKHKYMDNNYFEIFINPSLRELKDLISNSKHWKLRFIADKKTKKVYLVDSEVIHGVIADEIALSDDYRNLLSGIGTFGGKFEILSLSYDIESKIKHNKGSQLVDDILDGEYDWLDRYNFDIDEFKNEYLQDFLKGLGMHEDR